MKKIICIALFCCCMSLIFSGGGKENPESKTQYDLGTGQQIPRKTSVGDSVMQLFNKFYYSILETLINIQKKTFPYASALFTILMTLEIVYFGLLVMLGESNSLSAIIKKLLYYGVMTYVFFSFPQLVKIFKDSVVQIASLGLNTANYGDNPGMILYDAQENIINPFIMSLKQSLAGDQGVTGWEIVNPINAVKDVAITIWTSVLTFFLTILIQIPFVIIAIQICLANFELQIISTYIMIIFPFMIFTPLSFISKNGITTVLSATLKLAVSVFVGSLAMSGFMALFKPDTYAGLDFFFILIATLCLMAYLALQAPSLASTVISGMPSMSFAGAAQNAVGAFSAIYGAFKTGKAGFQKVADKANDAHTMSESNQKGESIAREYKNTTNNNNTTNTQSGGAQESKATGSSEQQTDGVSGNQSSDVSVDDKAASHVDRENTSGDKK